LKGTDGKNNTSLTFYLYCTFDYNLSQQTKTYTAISVNKDHPYFKCESIEKEIYALSCVSSSEQESRPSISIQCSFSSSYSNIDTVEKIYPL
jgi:hypothetical protein